jgi:MOSC domain-containing protein YiiM
MRILAVSTGRAAPLFVPVAGDTGEQVMSGIRKTPVSTRDDPRRIALGSLGLAGDEQVDLTVHGGRDKAVYAYPIEHYDTWRTIREQAIRIDEPLPPGFMGENLTIEGLLERRVWIGDVLVLEPAEPTDAPPVRLRVDGPRYPCFKFNARMGFKHASKMMVQSGFCGFYLEVLQTGTVAAGDLFQVRPGAREVTIEELFRLRTKGRQRDLL